MEKVLHPLCACGEPVMVHESWSPCYDDGGSVDSFDVDITYDTVCDMCYIAALPPVVYKPVIEPDEDDLPF
jgi:hypothetical protein